MTLAPLTSLGLVSSHTNLLATGQRRYAIKRAKPHSSFVILSEAKDPFYPGSPTGPARSSRLRPGSNSTLKNFLRQIPLRRIRNNRRPSLSRAQPPRPFQRRKHDRPTARSRQHAFPRRQPLHHFKRIIVRYRNHFIAYCRIKRLWDEVVPDPFHFVRPERSAAKDRTLRRHRNRQKSRHMLLHIPRHAGKRSAGAAAQNHRIDLPIHLLKHFHRSRFVVVVRIRLILKLPRHERAANAGHQLFCSPDRP